MHVPGWHEATTQLQEQGKVQMVGIIQEQHPDRARLFMQWKRMGWPILVDSYNLLDVSVVPITVTIDEHGIVRGTRLPVRAVERIEQDFVSPTFVAPSGAVAPPRSPDPARLRAAARQERTAIAWRAYADALALSSGPEQISSVISVYEEVVQSDPADARGHFRLGVAYRMRHDSALRQPGDFRSAVQHWTRALELDPNQYIWRRRIQQYGPRLDKPYPFYDWVAKARNEIQARGEKPAPLRVEPTGTELALPALQFSSADAAGAEPDPQGKILRDAGEFVLTETAVVPSTVEPGQAVRVHIEFRPNLAKKAHWNNEVDGLVMWLSPPEGWQVESRAVKVANPPQPVSQELRRVEVEVRTPAGASGRVTIPAYALYYVCEDINGICLYRRQDLAISVDVRKLGR